MPCPRHPTPFPGPNWAEYAVLWPHGHSYHATIADAAVSAKAGKDDFVVVRTGDSAQVWPYVNPRLPRGRA